MTLQELMDKIAGNWQFTGENYPEINKCSDLKRITMFAVRHILEHQVKALGQLATVIESWEHGQNDKMAEVFRPTIKIFRNTLRLSQIIGLSPAQLLSGCLSEE